MRAEFISKFPEITASVSEWNRATSLHKCFFGIEWNTTECDDNKILYLLAHLIVCIRSESSQQNAGIGIVSGKSVGSVSLNYAVTALTTKEQLIYGDFLKTVYGRVYLSLSKGAYKGGGVFV